MSRKGLVRVRHRSPAPPRLLARLPSSSLSLGFVPRPTLCAGRQKNDLAALFEDRRLRETRNHLRLLARKGPDAGHWNLPLSACPTARQ